MSNEAEHYEVDERHSDIDFERVALLIGVITSISNGMPQMQPILGAAQHELKLINDQAQLEQQEKAQARLEEEASRVEPRKTNLESAEPADRDKVPVPSTPIVRRA